MCRWYMIESWSRQNLKSSQKIFHSLKNCTIHYLSDSEPQRFMCLTLCSDHLQEIQKSQDGVDTDDTTFTPNFINSNQLVHTIKGRDTNAAKAAAQ